MTGKKNSIFNKCFKYNILVSYFFWWHGYCKNDVDISSIATIR